MAKRRHLYAEELTAKVGRTIVMKSATASGRIRPSTLPKGVAKARVKHSSDPLPPTTDPSLSDHFNALPPELRAHIFSLLLVRTSKWNLEHLRDCPLRTFPTLSSSQPNRAENFCARCSQGHETFLTRTTKAPWLNPQRSKWAPPVTNPFLCSNCWDEHLRPAPKPRTQCHDLPCLCARRQNLEVLLVCRQWYAEAGQVFYTRNIFAFENAEVFVSFVNNLSHRWREKLTRVSLLSEHRPLGSSKRLFRSVWRLLRDQLSSLSFLELDSVLLTDLDSVRYMRRFGLRNLRQLRFVRGRQDPGRGTVEIYPRYHRANLLKGGFAEEVARAVKGQGRSWMRRRRLLKWAVEREREVRSSRKGTDGIVDCSGLQEWAGLWDEVGYQHAFLPCDSYGKW